MEDQRTLTAIGILGVSLFLILRGSMGKEVETYERKTHLEQSATH